MNIKEMIFVADENVTELVEKLCRSQRIFYEYFGTENFILIPDFDDAISTITRK